MDLRTNKILVSMSRYLGKVLFIFALIFISFSARAESVNANKATDLLIAYFDTLIAKNIMNADHLKNIGEHHDLINPLTETDAAQSSTHHVYAKQLDHIINHLKCNDVLDHKTFKAWVVSKIEELETHLSTRELIHEETINTHYPLRFVALPAGTYTSQLDHKEFIISDGIEIQDSPVTQYQWASIMGKNHAHFSQGKDSYQIALNSESVKIQADYPIESVSYAQIREFINKLNEQDPQYLYDLLSIQEYEAFLQASFGSAWAEYLIKVDKNEQQPHAVTAQFYEMSGQRVRDLLGNIWQFTQDKVHLGNNINACVVFGSSYATKKDALGTLRDILRPIIYEDSIGKDVGFRLIRYKKGTSQ